MFITVVLIVLLKVVCCVQNNTIIIDVSSTNTTSFQQFWKSTGFCPPDPKEEFTKYLLSDEQKLNVALIGALPDQGIEYVRIHWLFNLLTTVQFNMSEPVYNYTYLDSYLSLLKYHDLTPGFELMAAPNKIVTFGKSGEFWKQLVINTVRRYIVLDKFGVGYVSKWRFETWNEPDLKEYNVLNLTLPEYLDYVYGCYSGLKEAFNGFKSGWKLGGPAGLFKDKNHPLCWGLLQACTYEETVCPIQFISFHKKGQGTASGVLNGSLELLDFFHTKHPWLWKRNIPVANDEADIEEGWSKSLEWRGDVRYAAMVVKVIAGYYKSVVGKRKLKIEVLSNDNAFLNFHPFYFTQRTLFARFQMNLTVPPHSQFVKKPAYSVMSLLSLLGGERLQEEQAQPDPLLTVVATRRNQGKQSFVSVVLAYGNESQSDEGNVGLINVLFKNIPEGEWKFLIYQLDNIRTNPYKVWKGFGRPVFPSRYQRWKMREVEEPKRLIDPAALTGPNLTISLKLSIPSVYLVNICTKPKKSPKRVRSVTVLNVTRNEVLITWKYTGDGGYSNCLRTFEVENQSKCSGSRRFKRINPTDTIFTSFHHVGKDDPTCEWTRGAYRVRAKDYWDRPGKYSEIISYP